MSLIASLDLTSRAILDNVADSMRDGSVSVFDRSLRYLYAAGPGLDGVGLTSDSLVGRALHDLYPPDEIALVEPHYRRALDGERVRFDLPVFNRIYEIAASPLTPDTIVVLAQDVSAVREAAAQRARQDRLVAVVAHELRQPLAPLRFGLELVKRRFDGVPREVLTIERQVSHLERLVADLGDVAQLAAGELAVRTTAVDLSAIVGSAVHDTVDQSGRRIVWEPGGPVIVHGDGERLYQVFANLLSNAVRHTTGQDLIEVRVREDGEQAVVTVRDEGSGIEADLLPRLFDAFVQGDGPRGRMGIGLHLVRAVVERHRGAVEVFSEGSGRGSRFTVTLPIGRL